VQRGAEMVGRLRSWWQQIKQHPFRSAIIIVLGIGLIVSLIGGYFFNWDWTGLGPYTPPTKDSNFQRARTLWDWLQLLIVPIMLAVGVFWLNQIQKSRDERIAEQRAESEQRAAEKRAQTEREIALDNQQQAALQAYFDKMSELLLHEHLGELAPSHEAVVIARARTATVLRILNPSRCASIIQFMSQAGILKLCVENSAKSSFDWPIKNEYSLAGIELPETNFNRVDLSMIHLEGANLYRASLREANLEEIDLSGANLQRANLMHANLQKANLGGANLQGTRLLGADLQGARLFGANLKDATGITIEELEKQTKSLKGATMPDGSIHP